MATYQLTQKQIIIKVIFSKRSTMSVVVKVVKSSTFEEGGSFEEDGSVDGAKNYKNQSIKIEEFFLSKQTFGTLTSWCTIPFAYKHSTTFTTACM